MGRPTFTSKMMPSEVQALHDMIASAAGYSVKVIRDRLGLEKIVGPKALSAYVKERREIVAAQRVNSQAAAAIESEEAMRRRIRLETLVRMGEQLATGEVKAHVLSKIHDSMFEADVEEAAERRAVELHATKMKNAEKAVKSEIAAPTTQASKDLRGILEAVAAGTLAVDEAAKQIGDVAWLVIDQQMRGG